MLWLKLTGGAAVLLAGYLISRFLNAAELRRLTQLDALIALLRFIKVQIDCFCVPVGEILRRCEPSVLERCGIATDGDIYERLTKPEPSPSGEILAVLRSFAGELGGSYREEQIKNCEYHINRLNAIREPLAAEVAKRMKLNRVLCLSAAAAVVILLI